nr:circumsporozoite protein-like [Globicephala melas]
MFKEFVFNEPIYVRVKNAKAARDRPPSPPAGAGPRERVEPGGRDAPAAGGDVTRGAGAVRHVAPAGARSGRGRGAGSGQALGALVCPLLRPLLRLLAGSSARCGECGSDPGRGGSEDATARVPKGRGPALPASGASGERPRPERPESRRLRPGPPPSAGSLAAGPASGSVWGVGRADAALEAGGGPWRRLARGGRPRAA